MSEPTDAFHLGEWSDFAARSYLDTAGISPAGNNWNSLSETTRLQYMTHLAADSTVPAKWHHPALEVNTIINHEKNIELGVGGWLSYIPVTGTCNYTNSKTGITHNYTGTITDALNNHYSAVIDNANWSRTHLRNSSAPFGYLFDKSDYDAAGDNATIQAQMLQRAVIADYILAKELPVVTADNYIGYSGGSITFDQSTSYDTDAIWWNSNGTYSQIYGCDAQGISAFYWDLNYDGVYDIGSTYNAITLSTWDLLNMGLPANQWDPYTVMGYDNEGKTQTATGYVWLDAGGLMMMTAVPEPGSFVLLAIAAATLLLLKCKRRG
jgi:hypothetical protein